jgi:glycosyltransferase involved in cell wall biosynthesis
MALEYVIITPARNEAAFIEKTIQSVIVQTVLPKRWVIVSDGSTDGTDEIVENYVRPYNWIKLLRMPKGDDRHFGRKAICFNAGYDSLRELAFDVVGNVDGDVSFGPGYFAFLLAKFRADPRLGVAGTRYVEEDDEVAIFSARDVAGQCQLFRRECLEDVGGYVPSRYGGVDWMAVRMARMQGWSTRTFEGEIFRHHRIMSSAEANRWIARIRTGRKDYVLGNHPLWEVLRIGYQLSRKPYVIGGLLMALGYFQGVFSRIDRPFPRALLEFHRKEQMERLKEIAKNLRRLKKTLNEV